MTLFSRLLGIMLLLGVTANANAKTCQERFDELHNYIKNSRKKVKGTIYVRTGSQWKGGSGIAGRFMKALVIGEAKVRINGKVHEVTAFMNTKQMRVSVDKGPSQLIGPVLCGGEYPITNFVAPLTVFGENHPIWLKFDRS